MSYSKPMPALMAAAAGNYITMWLSDFTGLLRFPRRGPFLIYDFVIRLFSAMFYCEKDKPMCQREPVWVAGTLRREFLLLTTSVWVRMYRRSWPLFVSYQSLRLTLPGSRTFFDDCGFMEMLCLLYLWGRKSAEWRVEVCFTEFCRIYNTYGPWQCFFIYRRVKIRFERQWIFVVILDSISSPNCGKIWLILTEIFSICHQFITNYPHYPKIYTLLLFFLHCSETPRTLWCPKGHRYLV